MRTGIRLCRRIRNRTVAAVVLGNEVITYEIIIIMDISIDLAVTRDCPSGYLNSE